MRYLCNRNPKDINSLTHEGDFERQCAVRSINQRHGRVIKCQSTAWVKNKRNKHLQQWSNRNINN